MTVHGDDATSSLQTACRGCRLTNLQQAEYKQCLRCAMDVYSGTTCSEPVVGVAVDRVTRLHTEDIQEREMRGTTHGISYETSVAVVPP